MPVVSKNGAKIYVGEEHPSWKGQDVGYAALHEWVIKYKPNDGKCSACGEQKKLDAANISQQYVRDVNDWEYLCRSCHMKKDGRINNLRRGRKEKEYAPCGAGVVARGICMKQYNYERRSKAGVRRLRCKPCSECNSVKH